MDREKEIGKRIREIRELKGMTLEILARKTKFTKGYLSRLENSKKAPPVATLLSIARALDVRIADIFGETEEHTSLSIVRKNDRLMMARSGTIFGYHYESLVHKFKNKSMAPIVSMIKVTPTIRNTRFITMVSPQKENVSSKLFLEARPIFRPAISKKTVDNVTIPIPPI